MGNSNSSQNSHNEIKRLFGNTFSKNKREKKKLKNQITIGNFCKSKWNQIMKLKLKDYKNIPESKKRY